MTELLGVLGEEQSNFYSSTNRTKVCPDCGHSIEDLTATGTVGCCTCYTVFADEIDRLVREIHGLKQAGQRKLE